MVKLRKGFVSNSSSSSFIIKNDDPNVNLDEIKQKIVQKVHQDYIENRLNDEDYKSWYEKHPGWAEYHQKEYGTTESINEMVDVRMYKDYEHGDFLSYFYTRNFRPNDIIISDNNDNYFSQEVKEWIEEEFETVDSCWHMG